MPGSVVEEWSKRLSLDPEVNITIVSCFKKKVNILYLFWYVHPYQ